MVAEGGLGLGWVFGAVGLALVLVGAVAQDVAWEWKYARIVTLVLSPPWQHDDTTIDISAAANCAVDNASFRCDPY
jgi:hypothetical protein